MGIQSIGSPILWVGFTLFVLVLLVLDLGIFHRKAHEISIKEALGWTLVWIALALTFNAIGYWKFGGQHALEFLTGYLIEKALSVDNLFVFLVIFSYFLVPLNLQHRVLFWGILGALVMRAFFIVTGAALLQTFHWIMYIFGGFLVITGIRLLWPKDEGMDVEKNPILRLFRRFVPCTASYHGTRFFVREGGRIMATPLLMVLVMVETTDIVFAVDSIPAIFAVTEDPFIVYTSNIFAILGLRALYFVLAGMMGKFFYLRYGLAFVLAFVGVKMLIADLYKIPIGLSLLVVAALLSISVGLSLVFPPKKPPSIRLTYVPGAKPDTEKKQE